MKTRLICLLILSVFLVFTLLYSETQDWPMHNSCRECTNFAADENDLQPPFHEIGVLKVDGLIEQAVYQNLTWYDHTLCVSIFDSSANLFAMFDTDLEDTLWTFRVPSTIEQNSYSPAQNDSLVLIGGFQGPGLFALDRLTGEQKWFQPMSTLYARSPIFDDERIYITAGALKCIYTADGSPKWGRPDFSAVTPSVDESYCFAIGINKLECYNKINAGKIWSQYNSRFSYVGVALMGDQAYTFTSDSIVAYDKSTGTVDWIYQATGCGIAMMDQNAIAVSDSVLCCAIWSNPDGKGQLLALNRTDGTYRWHYDFDYVGCNTPTIFNGVVCTVQATRSELFIFDLSTGEMLWRDRTHLYRYQAIVADHRLYVPSRGDGVIVFESVPVEIDHKEEAQPALFTLHQNIPNPFNPETVIRYALDTASDIEIAIFSIKGHLICLLEKDYETAGNHSITWTGKDQQGRPVPSGIYLCRFKAGGSLRTIRMLMLK